MVWQWLLGRAKVPQDAAELGRWGEDQACRFLQGKGFTTIARNWRFGKGELDLVMADGRAIVFIEIKSRADEDFVPARLSITTKKKTNFTANRKVLSEKIQPLRQAFAVRCCYGGP